jgi:hypothetical protein
MTSETIQLGNSGIHPYLQDMLNQGFPRQIMEQIFSGDFYEVPLTDTKDHVTLTPSYIKYISRCFRDSSDQTIIRRLQMLFDNIALCENLSPPKTKQEYMTKICDFMYKADKVVHVIPDGLEKLFNRFPHYRSLYRQRYTNEVLADKFMQTEYMRQLSDAQTCILL